MTPEQQLDYVEKYLRPYKGRIGNLKDLYLAIFAPSAIGKPDSTPVYTQKDHPQAYAANAPLDVDKKGYITVGDAYGALVRKSGWRPQTAPALAQAPAPGTPTAPADALTNRYITQFTKGSEQDALIAVVAAEDSGDQTKALAAKRALEQVFPRGQAQTAAAAARPDTSMLVAGNAAPAPSTAPGTGPGAGSTSQVPSTMQAPVTTPDTSATTPPPFQLSLEGRRQILANNRTIERNEQEIRDLDMKQRQANYLAATRKNPQLGAVATQLGQRIADLSRQNQSLRDMSERTLQDESQNGISSKEKLEERRRRPGELAAEKTAERTAEERYLDTQPIGEHPRVKSEEYFDKKTGDPIDDAMTTRQWRAQNKVGNLTRLADTDSRKQLTTLKMLEPLLKQYADLVQYAYGTREDGTPGPLAQFSRSPYATTSAMINQGAQNDPTLQAKRRALEGQLQSVVRALGARGDLNQQELEAAQQMLANMHALVGLGLSLSSGPMVGTGGFGIGVGGTVKPSISIPDMPAVGVKLANELVDLVNSRIGSLLRNKDYKGTPAITLPGTHAAVPSSPTSGPTRLQEMTPEEIRNAGDEVIADVNRPSDIPGLSDAQKKALALRLRQRSEAAVKLRRAS